MMSGPELFFNGSIPEAIGLAQKSSKLFLVYIANDGEESRKLEETTWKSSQVVNIVTEKAIAVRLVHGSVDVTHFSALYPVSRMPSITVVGCEGVQIWQHHGYISEEELAGKLQQAAEIYRLQLQQAAKTMAAALLGISHSSTASQTSVTMQQTISSSDLENPATATTIHAGSGQENAQPEAENMETSGTKAEIVESAVKSIEKNAESRSSLKGKSVFNSDEEFPSATELQASGSSQQLRTTSGVSLDDVGAAVTSSGKPDQSPTKLEETTTRHSDAQKSEAKPLKVPDKISLQLKLTDGAVIRKEFEKTDDLWTVKAFVDANRTDGTVNYNFATPFPRKVFAAEDYERALIDLDIGYRAVLILVPTKDNKPIVRKVDPSSPNGSSVGRWLSYINPIAYMRGNPSADERSKSPTSPKSPTATSSGNAKAVKKSGASWGGNIHTLKHDEDDMFRRGNTYWNGNNTQFGSNDENK